MTKLEAGIVSVQGASLAQFYMDGMGFHLDQLLEFPQGQVWRLVNDQAGLKIYQPAEGATASTPADPWFAASGFAYAALHVDNADAQVATATAAGAKVITPVTAHRPGARFALLADPEGNTWEILEDHNP